MPFQRLRSISAQVRTSGVEVGPHRSAKDTPTLERLRFVVAGPLGERGVQSLEIRVVASGTPIGRPFVPGFESPPSPAARATTVQAPDSEAPSQPLEERSRLGAINLTRPTGGTCVHVQNLTFIAAFPVQPRQSATDDAPNDPGPESSFEFRYPPSQSIAVALDGQRVCRWVSSSDSREGPTLRSVISISIM
jgi:hypothetical protein